MSHATEQHETHSSGPLAWAAFLLAPFILLRMMCACVRATAEHFRLNRKAIAARRADDWRSFIDELVDTEFMVFDFTVSGARMLLATGAVDLLAVTPTLDRSRFHVPPPRSARELAMRIETACRILSAPEAGIRRLASRMARAAGRAPHLPGCVTVQPQGSSLQAFSAGRARQVLFQKKTAIQGSALATGPPHPLHATSTPPQKNGPAGQGPARPDVLAGLRS